MTTQPYSDPNDPAAQAYQQPVQTYDDSMKSIYSSFWAVGLVFTILCILNIVDVVNLYQLRGQRQKQDKNSQQEYDKLKQDYAKYLPRAKTVDTTLNGLSRDIIEMASSHPAAKQIVNDFKIQLVNPPADKTGEESSSSPSTGKTK